jgi:hypothetical protein
MPPFERTPSGRVMTQPDPAKARAKVAVARTHHILSASQAKRWLNGQLPRGIIALPSADKAARRRSTAKFGGTIDQQRERGRKCELVLDGTVDTNEFAAIQREPRLEHLVCRAGLASP